MRACRDCGLPVTQQNAEAVGDGSVRHKPSIGCPQPIASQPQHTGKKHAGFQAQLRVADHCKTIRELTTKMKELVEAGQLGSDEMKDVATEVADIAEAILNEYWDAKQRRRELDRGK